VAAPIVALKSRETDVHQKRHRRVAIAKSNGNTSKKVLGTHKNRVEIHLWVVEILPGSRGGLGKIWVRAGHQVLFSSRHPNRLKVLIEEAGPGAYSGTVADAALFGDAILFSPNFWGVDDALEATGPLKGKTVIDATNPLVWNPNGRMVRSGEREIPGASGGTDAGGDGKATGFVITLPHGSFLMNADPRESPALSFVQTKDLDNKACANHPASGASAAYPAPTQQTPGNPVSVLLTSLINTFFLLTPQGDFILQFPFDGTKPLDANNM
jgi:hypothetical protein